MARAKAADGAERNEPEVDIPAEIAQREARRVAIAAARERLEQRQRETDLQRGATPTTRTSRAARTTSPRRPLSARLRPTQGYGAGELRQAGQPDHAARRRRVRCQLVAPDLLVTN